MILLPPGGAIAVASEMYTHAPQSTFMLVFPISGTEQARPSGHSRRTPAAVRDLLPGAFSVVNITEGDLDRNRAEIKAGVAAGDILMFRGWFADKRNEWVKALYEEVKKEKK